MVLKETYLCYADHGVSLLDVLRIMVLNTFDDILEFVFTDALPYLFKKLFLFWSTLMQYFQDHIPYYEAALTVVLDGVLLFIPVQIYVRDWVTSIVVVICLSFAKLIVSLMLA